MENGNYGHKNDPNTSGEHSDKNDASVRSLSSTKIWGTSFSRLKDFWSHADRGGSSSYHKCKSLVSITPVPEEHTDNTQSNDANVASHITGNKKYYSEDGYLVTGRKGRSLRSQLQYDNVYPEEKSNYISRRKRNHKIHRHHVADEMVHSVSVMRNVSGNDVTRSMNVSHETTYSNTRKHSDTIEYASSRKQSVGGRRNSMGEPQNYFVHEENGSIYKDVALDDARIMNDRYSDETRRSIPNGRKSSIGSRRESASENKTKVSLRNYPPSTTGSHRNNRSRTSYDGLNQGQSRIFQRTEDSSSVLGDDFNSRAPAYATKLSHETQRLSGNSRDLEQFNAPMANEGKASRQERSMLYEEGSRIPSKALRNVSDVYDDVEDERRRITQEPATGFHRESFGYDIPTNCACNRCPLRDELIYKEAIDPRSSARSNQRDGSNVRSYASQARGLGGSKRPTIHETIVDETFEKEIQKIYREPISPEEQIFHDSEFQSSFSQNGTINGRRSTPLRRESHIGQDPPRRSNNNESVERRKTLINRVIGSNGEVIFEDRYDDPDADYTFERRQTQPETFGRFSNEDSDRRETPRTREMESEPDDDMIERERSSAVKPISREQSLKYSHADVDHTVRASGGSGSLRASRGGTEQLDEYITQERRSALDERRVSADLQRQSAQTHLLEAENSYNDVSTEMVDGLKRGTYDEQRSIAGSQKSFAEQEDGASYPKRSTVVSKQGAPKLGSKRGESMQKSLLVERETLGTEEAVIPRNSRRISDNSYYPERPVYRDEDVDSVGGTQRGTRASAISSRAIDRGTFYDRSLLEGSEPVYEDILPVNEVELTKHSLAPGCQCGCQDLVQRAHSQRSGGSTHSNIPVRRLSKSKPEALRDEERPDFGERSTMLQSLKRISHTDDDDYNYGYDDDADDSFEEGNRTKTSISERQSEKMPPREILRTNRPSTNQELLESTGVNRESSPVYDEFNDLERRPGLSPRASGDYRRYSSRGGRELNGQRRDTPALRTSVLKSQRGSEMKNYDTADRTRQTLNEIRRNSPYNDARDLDSDLDGGVYSSSSERQHLQTDSEADMPRHSRRITEHSYPEPVYISGSMEGKLTHIGSDIRRYTSHDKELENVNPSIIHERIPEIENEQESQVIYDEQGIIKRQTADNVESVNGVQRFSRMKSGSMDKRESALAQSDDRKYTSQGSAIEHPRRSTLRERKADRRTEKESQMIYDEPRAFKRQTSDDLGSLNENQGTSRQEVGSMNKRRSTLPGSDVRNASYSGQLEKPVSIIPERGESQKVYDEPANFRRRTNDNSEYRNEVRRISRQMAGSMEERRPAPDGPDVRRYTNRLSKMENHRIPIVRERTSERTTVRENHKIYEDPRSYGRETINDLESQNEIQRLSRQQAGYIDNGRSFAVNPMFRRSEGGRESKNSRR